MSVSALVLRLQAERAWITQPVRGRDSMRAARSCALSALEAWKPEGQGKRYRESLHPALERRVQGQHPNSLLPALTTPRPLLPIAAWAGAPPVLRNSRPLPHHTTVSNAPCHRCSKTSEVKVTQSCPTLCNPTDYSPPGSSVHGILQARILEWRAIPFSRGSSPHRDQTQVSCITGRF